MSQQHNDEVTIRNGAAVMKGYSWAMTDEEMGSVTEYLKTLDGVNYGAPPEPEAADEAAMEGAGDKAMARKLEAAAGALLRLQVDLLKSKFGV